MSLSFAAFVEEWLTEFNLQAVRDILLESLTVVAFIFLLVVMLIMFVKAPMIIKHGSIEMIIFVILGFAHSIMNIFDEFAWIGPYDEWKLTKDLLLLVGVVILFVGFFRFFQFSARLYGFVEVDDKLTDIEEPNTKEID